MPETKLEITTGEELTAEELAEINKYRLQEFHSDTLLEPATLDKFKMHIFFLLKDNAGSLLAFARLKQVAITFQGQTFQIWGIAMVVAIIKGKGYGKALMQGIKQYILESGKSAIGFCAAGTSGFYSKSGFNILPAAGDRFFYQNPEGNLVPNPDKADDVIYLDGKDRLLEIIIQDKQLPVIADIPHW